MFLPLSWLTFFVRPKGLLETMGVDGGRDKGRGRRRGLGF